MGKPCLFPDCEENASWVLKYDICYRFWWIPFIRLKKILFSFWFSKVFYHEKVRDLIKIFFCIGRSYSFSPLISSCGDIELSFKVLLVMIHYLYVNILTYTYIFTWKCEYMMNNQHMIWFGSTMLSLSIPIHVTELESHITSVQNLLNFTKSNWSSHSWL